jgi:hypothetical protein
MAAVPDPHDTFSSPFEAYIASKRIARAESIKFIAETKPGFDLINILPPVILGKNELITSSSSMATAGTNRYIINIITGETQPPVYTVSGSVHVVFLKTYPKMS